MKFTTSLFSRLDIFSPSYIKIEEGRITIVANGIIENDHANNIKYVDIETPKIGFSTLDLIIRIPARKISVYGFTRRQCEEINAAINTYQINNFKFVPLKLDLNFKAMQSLTLILKGLSTPRKFELPLISTIAGKLEEGINIVRKLRDIDLNKDFKPVPSELEK